MTPDLNAQMHASELASLAAFLRAVFGRAREDVGDVVSMALTVTHDADGLSVIEAELRDRAGHVLGGFGL